MISLARMVTLLPNRAPEENGPRRKAASDVSSIFKWMSNLNLLTGSTPPCCLGRCTCVWELSLRWFGFRHGTPPHTSVFFSKALHAACAIDQLLLAREKRMAARTDFDVQNIALISGAGRERAPARAHNLDFVIIGMDVFLH